MNVQTRPSVRAAAVAAAAAQWRDRGSPVRARARESLAQSIWPPAAVETALDNVLWDLDERRALELSAAARGTPAAALVFLPGNIIGPAVQSAFCAALAGARAILKTADAERGLASVASEQFANSAHLAGTIEARDFRRGDLETESAALAEMNAVVAFGEDATIEQIRARAGERRVVGYGESYSIAYVAGDTDIAAAAGLIARDVCLFDQRGCMSPQTIFVAGEPGRALRHAHALARALGEDPIPRARSERGEEALVAAFVRRLAATALPPAPHGLDTLLLGRSRDGAPEFAVALEPFGQPVCAGFGRIVIVKPAPSARDVATQLRYFGRAIETIACSADTTQQERAAFTLAGAQRICALGEMQRPPFGYRPAIADFLL
ncbi:MAG: hypothetical protein JO219_09625 [Candidatus Eremiobacteraeota bacterium]|nr:hypothetical protein [Candidatus Eremiobacteraeota bacterium]